MLVTERVRSRKLVLVNVGSLLRARETIALFCNS